MYSVPDSAVHRSAVARSNCRANMRTWLTVRNDDIYSFRWGDPEFARAYIRNCRDPTSWPASTWAPTATSGAASSSAPSRRRRASW